MGSSLCCLSKLRLLITAMLIVFFFVLCFGFKLDLCDILYAFLFDVRNLNTWILDLCTVFETCTIRLAIYTITGYVF